MKRVCFLVSTCGVDLSLAHFLQQQCAHLLFLVVYLLESGKNFSFFRFVKMYIRVRKFIFRSVLQSSDSCDSAGARAPTAPGRHQQPFPRRCPLLSHSHRPVGLLAGFARIRGPQVLVQIARAIFGGAVNYP